MEEDDAAEFVSKTKRKQEMHDLQTLGASLVDLPLGMLEKLDLSDNLRRAVMEARQMRSHGARRRQIQYIGRLMRDIDPAPLRARLHALGMRP